MLYITTRCSREVYTACRPLKLTRGPEGGVFVPFRGPELQDPCWERLDFHGWIAAVLNRFFRTALTAWDVRCAIGRSPVRFTALNHRILIAELWHNPAEDYRFLEDGLLAALGAGEGWPRIAVRVAVLSGIGRLLRAQGVHAPDVSTLTGDFLWPISARYARSWGSDMGTIVCTCNENQALWDLLSHGQLRTDLLAVKTQVEEGDIALPAELERLIYEAGGREEVLRYLDICARGGVYVPGKLVLEELRRGLAAQVVSAERVESLIPGAYRTHGYVLEKSTALAYAGLLDYRARTGNIGPAVVLATKKGCL